MTQQPTSPGEWYDVQRSFGPPAPEALYRFLSIFHMKRNAYATAAMPASTYLLDKAESSQRELGYSHPYTYYLWDAIVREVTAGEAGEAVTGLARADLNTVLTAQTVVGS
jgi:hypothetical protein